MPYVVFIKAPSWDHLRYMQHNNNNNNQKPSKMKTVKFEYFVIVNKKFSIYYFRKVVSEMIHF